MVLPSESAWIPMAASVTPQSMHDFGAEQPASAAMSQWGLVCAFFHPQSGTFLLSYPVGWCNAIAPTYLAAARENVKIQNRQGNENQDQNKHRARRCLNRESLRQ